MSDKNPMHSAASPPYSGKRAVRAVISETLQQPLTLFPTAFGLLGAMTFLMLEPTMLVAGLSAGFLSVGVGSWFFNYFVRGKSFEAQYLKRMLKEINEKKQALLENLEEDLKAAAEIEGAGEHSRQSLTQFHTVREQFENLQKLLEEKLSTSELTYGRYFVTAEQVYLSVLDNLEKIASLLKSIQNIDVGYIEERLRNLEELKPLPPADIEERATLKERFLHRQTQMDKVNTLLTYNEKAMTKLDCACTAVAEMETQRGHASVDLQTAMGELEELTRRAKKF